MSEKPVEIQFRVGEDEITAALEGLARNSSSFGRLQTLRLVGNYFKNKTRDGIEKELQYDGKPMKSPAKKTRLGGRFAASYKYRYYPGTALAKGEELKRFKSSGRIGTRKLKIDSAGRARVRRRKPVTSSSKQLNFTGLFRKSIDILSGDSKRIVVGSTTGHGNRILSFHNSTRKPLGISKQDAEEVQKIAYEELLKGV